MTRKESAKEQELAKDLALHKGDPQGNLQEVQEVQDATQEECRGEHVVQEVVVRRFLAILLMPWLMRRPKTDLEISKHHSATQQPPHPLSRPLQPQSP